MKESDKSFGAFSSLIERSDSSFLVEDESKVSLYFGKHFYKNNYLCDCSYKMDKALHPFRIWLNLMYYNLNSFVL